MKPIAAYILNLQGLALSCVTRGGVNQWALEICELTIAILIDNHGKMLYTVLYGLISINLQKGRRSILIDGYPIAFVRE